MVMIADSSDTSLVDGGGGVLDKAGGGGGRNLPTDGLLGLRHALY